MPFSAYTNRHMYYYTGWRRRSTGQIPRQNIISAALGHSPASVMFLSLLFLLSRFAMLAKHCLDKFWAYQEFVAVCWLASSVIFDAVCGKLLCLLYTNSLKLQLGEWQCLRHSLWETSLRATSKLTRCSYKKKNKWPHSNFAAACSPNSF